MWGWSRGGVLLDFGHDVVCLDTNPDKVAMLERGELPIFEPGLGLLMEKNVAAGPLCDMSDRLSRCYGVPGRPGVPA